MNIDHSRPDYDTGATASPVSGAKVSLAAVSLSFAAIDAIVITAVTAALGAIYYHVLIGGEFFSIIHLKLGAVAAFFIVAASILQGSYNPDEVHAISDHPDRLALSIVFGLIAVILLLFAAKKSIDYSRLVVLASGVLSFLVLIKIRRTASLRLAALAREGRVVLPKIFVLGSHNLIAEFLATKDTRRPVCHPIVNEEVAAEPGDPRFEAAIASARRQVQKVGAESIILCLPWSDRKTIEAYIERLAELPCAIYLSHDQSLRQMAGLVSPLERASLGHTLVRRPLSASQLLLKRAFDFTGALAGLILLSPLLAIMAAMIKFDSEGPVLFRQLRYGFNRAPFYVYKFRTMTAKSSQEAFRQATRGDPRITRVGRYLRKGSLDELPQLLNVLFGQMSLVGPRPHPVELDDRFMPLIPHYATRHKIKPGITGWAQVNGHRGETGSTARMQERIAHDLWYLNHWSFWLDIKILLMTVISMASHRNAI